MALAPLGDDEKGLSQFPTLGGPQRLRYVTESGLYKLVMRSDKPAAKPFQDWVTREALPAIRKDGAYIMGEEKVRTGEMSEDELVLKAVGILQRKVERLTGERDAAMAAEQRERAARHEAEAQTVVEQEKVRALTPLARVGEVSGLSFRRTVADKPKRPAMRYPALGRATMPSRMDDTNEDTGHDFKRPISNGPNDRPRDEPIGQSGAGLPDDSSLPVEITPDEERRIAAKILEK